MLTDSITLASRRTLPANRTLAWLTCLSAGLFFFYEFFQLNVFDVINEPLRHEFALDASQVSWLSSTYLWADILFLLPAGIVLDRFSTRNVILTALMVCILGTFGFGLCHTFRLAAFFHFLSGIGNAFCFLSCIVLVSRWFEPARQGLVIGCIVTMAFLGGMMAHTPFAWLNTQYGWRQAMMIDGALGLVFLFWIFCTVYDAPAGYILKRSGPGPLLTRLHSVLANRQNWLAGLYTACMNLPIMVLCALWGANYLQTVHQLPDMGASNVVSLIFMGSIAGCPLAGWISDRMGRRKPVMLAGALCTLAVMIPLMHEGALSVATLSILFLAVGFFTSTQVIAYPLVAESNADNNTGTANGMASILIMGGAGIAQVLFGVLIQFHAGNGASGYHAADFHFAMWLFPAALLIALLALACIRETWCGRSRT